MKKCGIPIYLKYNPKIRASAAESIKHRFFSSLPHEVYTLENSKYEFFQIPFFTFIYFIFLLDQSIFDITSITLTKDPGTKLNNAGKVKLIF